MTTRKEQKSTGRGAPARRRAPGRHEKAVEVALLDLQRAGLLAANTDHLRTALRANGRALDEAERAGNAYGTRQATRSLLELHEALTAQRTDEGDVSAWLARVPDTVPDDLA